MNMRLLLFSLVLVLIVSGIWSVPYKRLPELPASLGETPYAILGIDPGATEIEIQKAYRRLALQIHPDKYHDPIVRQQADELMRQVNNARDTLLMPPDSEWDEGIGCLSPLWALWASFFGSCDDCLPEYGDQQGPPLFDE